MYSEPYGRYESWQRLIDRRQWALTILPLTRNHT